MSNSSAKILRFTSGVIPTGDKLPEEKLPAANTTVGDRPSLGFFGSHQTALAEKARARALEKAILKQLTEAKEKFTPLLTKAAAAHAWGQPLVLGPAEMATACAAYDSTTRAYQSYQLERNLSATARTFLEELHNMLRVIEGLYNNNRVQLEMPTTSPPDLENPSFSTPSMIK